MKHIGKWVIWLTLGLSLSFSTKVGAVENVNNIEAAQFNIFQSIILGMVQG